MYQDMSDFFFNRTYNFAYTHRLTHTRSHVLSDIRHTQTHIHSMAHSLDFWIVAYTSTATLTLIFISTLNQWANVWISSVHFISFNRWFWLCRSFFNSMEIWIQISWFWHFRGKTSFWKMSSKYKIIREKKNAWHW